MKYTIYRKKKLKTVNRRYDIKVMLNVNKLPHLQPKKKEEPQPEGLRRQIKDLGYHGYAIILFSLFLIYFVVCFQAEQSLRSKVYDTLKETGANGFGIKYSKPKSAYLALKSGLYIDDLVLTAPDYLGGWEWKAGRIGVSLNPFTPRTVTISLAGTHSLKTKSSEDIRLLVEKGEIDVSLPSKENQGSLFMEIENVLSTAPASMNGFHISGASLAIRKTPATDSGFAKIKYTFEMSNFHLSKTAAKHLPEMIEYLGLSGDITGVSTENQKPVLADWMENSGTVEIKKGELIWKPLMAEFSGTAGFDSSFDLMAATTAKVYGFFSMMEKMEKADIIRPRNLSIAKVVLGPKLKIIEGESQPSLSSSFTSQGGKVYAGQVVLYEEKK